MRIRVGSHFFSNPHLKLGLRRGTSLFLFVTLTVLSGNTNLLFPLIIAFLAASIARLDVPRNNYWRRLLLAITSFTLASLFALTAQHFSLPLVPVFFTLAFIFGLYAIRGSDGAIIGLGSMLITILSLVEIEHLPKEMIPVTIFFSTFLFGIVGRIWIIFWPAMLLRPSIAQLYTLLSEYLQLRQQLINSEMKPDKVVKKALILHHRFLEASNEARKQMVAVYSEQSSAMELLRQRFALVLDLYEQLTSVRLPAEKVQEITQLTDITLAVSSCYNYSQKRLKSISEALIQNKAVKVNDINALHKALDNCQNLSEDKASGLLSAELLLSTQSRWKRILDSLSTLQPYNTRVLKTHYSPIPLKELLAELIHLKSPVLRSTLRFSVAIALGEQVTLWLELSQSHWILLTIIFVIQGGFLFISKQVLERMAGTLIGVILAAMVLLLQPPVWVILCLITLTFPISYYFSTRFGGTVATLTFLLILFLQILTQHGLDYLYPRIIDTVLGCFIALIVSLLLWPQNKSPAIKKDFVNAFSCLNHYIQKLIPSLAHSEISPHELGTLEHQSRLAQDRLLLSYQSTLQEPFFNKQLLKKNEILVRRTQMLFNNLHGLKHFSGNRGILSQQRAKLWSTLLLSAISHCSTALKTGQGNWPEELDTAWESDNLTQLDPESQQLEKQLLLLMQMLTAIHKLAVSPEKSIN